MGNYRSFTSTPNTSLCPHLHFPLHLFNQRGRALLWRGRHHPSSGRRRRFHWRPFVTHLLSIFHQHNRAFFGERQGLRFNKFPIRIQRDHTNTQSPPKKGKQAHQQQQAPQTHPSASQARCQTSHQASPEGPPKKNHDNFPKLPHG